MGRLAVAVRRRCRRIATDRPATDVTVVVRGFILVPSAPRLLHTQAEPERCSLSFHVRATGGAGWARPCGCAASDDPRIMTHRDRFRQTPPDPGTLTPSYPWTPTIR